VLSKCANPACLARFHYLHEGRIFNVDRGTVASDRNSPAIRKIEHFWLCESCAQTLTVVLMDGVVTTRPLRPELAEHATEEKFQGKRSVA
jgi:hypothetical protein